MLRECTKCGDPLYDYMTRCAKCGQPNPWSDPESDDVWVPPPPGPPTAEYRTGRLIAVLLGVVALAGTGFGLLSDGYQAWARTGYPSRFFIPAVAMLVALIVAGFMWLWGVVEERQGGGSKRPGNSPKPRG
jgi:hypothetical protein